MTTSRTLREVNQRVDDDQSPRPDDGPTPLDDVVPLGLDDADSAAFAHVTQALGALTFLRPDGESRTDDEPMPDWVWARLSDALAAEATPSRRAPAWARWGGGLVAASVAVLAIGLAVTSFSGSGDPAAVVADAAPEAATAPLGASLPQGDAVAARSAIGERPTLSFAGMVPPALRLIDSQTDYTSEQLEGQVSDVLEAMDMEPASAMAALKAAPAELALPEALDPAPGGMLLSSRSLRDCITKLTKVATSTALLVDWTTYDGQAAGVIITPDYPDTGAAEPNMREIDVWVVDHDCDTEMTFRHMRMP